MLQNCRSLTNKAIYIHENICEKNLDFLFLTETWLRGDLGDGITISDALPSDFSTFTVNRLASRGGIAIIYKTIYTFFYTIFYIYKTRFGKFHTLPTYLLNYSTLFYLHRNYPSFTFFVYIDLQLILSPISLKN